MNYLFHFINSSFILSYTTEIDLFKTTFNTKEKKDYSHPNYPDYYFPDFQKISNKPHRLIKYCTVHISPIYIYITPLNKITSHYTSLKFHLFHQPLPQILISPAYKIPSPVPTSTYRGEIEWGSQLLSRITLSRATPWYRETRPAKPKEISEQCIGEGRETRSSNDFPDSPLSSPLARPDKGASCPDFSSRLGERIERVARRDSQNCIFARWKLVGGDKRRGSLVRINLRGVRGFK